MIEIIATIVVAALGSSWVGQLLVNKFSKNSNAEILKRIDAVDAKVDRNEAGRLRERILMFNVELLRHMKHTREDFIDVLGAIDRYESYCRSHPEYPNNRATVAVQNIKDTYEKSMRENLFL